MPLISFSLHAGSTTAEKRRAMSGAVHEAMREVLDIPADDKFHLFHEYEEGFFFHEDVIFGLPRDNRLVLITLSFNERPAEVKQRLFAAVVRLMRERAGVTSDQIGMRILETARENWWADGRVVDPATGYDARMTPQ
jgi:phenylpyruvate tautomerase PptA (4-oxalocrotonate tautomerase family)